MRRFSLTSLCLPLTASLLFALTACSSDPDNDQDTDTGTDIGIDAVSDVEADVTCTTTPCDLPEAVCTAGTQYAPGTTIFEDRTAEWGLADIGAQGVRISVSDIDGDSYPDLIVRRGGLRSDDFDEDVRHNWVLHNTGGAGFEDVTYDSGMLDPRTAFEGARGRPGDVYAFGDVDNDGDMDVYTGTNTSSEDALGETSELMRNNGSAVFSFTAADHALRNVDEAEHVSGASFVDFDRDGNLDVWITRYAVDNSPQQDRLYRGDGEGNFEDVTIAAGLQTQEWEQISDLNEGLAHSNAWAALACDLDSDGTPELLAASYGRAPNHVFHGQFDGQTTAFDNVSVDSGYAFDHRTDWSDNQSAMCHCKLNPDAEGCADVPDPDLIRCTTSADVFRWNHNQDRNAFRLGGNSGTTVCADLNNDGFMDLVTTEIVHWDVGSTSDPSEILWNQGTSPPTFDRPGGEVSGITRTHVVPSWNDGDITGTTLDFDNDGWGDIYIGSTDYPGARGLLYWQDTPEHFVEVPIADWAEHNRSHGVVVADFDRDGDSDLLVGHSRGRCDESEPNNCYETQQVRMFENVLGDSGNWVQIDLEGIAGTNRDAIGARVEVTTPDGVTRTQEVGGGYGHYGMQNDHALHFGLGANCTAEVTVRWPNAELTTQSFDIVSGYRFDVLQGADPVVNVPANR